MSLDVYLRPVPPAMANDEFYWDEPVFWANYTHNIGNMADAAGLYDCVWRPEEHGITTAAQLIEPLQTGIARMEADPARFQAMDSPNGWGRYESFVPWLKQYLAACIENPDALVSVSR